MKKGEGDGNFGEGFIKILKSVGGEEYQVLGNFLQSTKLL